MLRLVDGGGTPASDLRRVGLYGLDPELAAYVRRLLLARWPKLVVTLAQEPSDLARVRLQLWICGRSPPGSVNAPVLWLDGYGQDEDAPARIAPQLWRLTTPVTRARLLHGVERILAA